MAQATGATAKVGFEIPEALVGKAAGGGRVYELTLERGSRRGETSVTKVVDLDAEANLSEVVDLRNRFGIEGDPDMGDDVLMADVIARRAAAVDLVDYEAFTSDSAYLDAFDAVMGDFHVVDAHRAGTRVRYEMLMAYGDAEEGEWGDFVLATDEEDATFQARWTCAENAGSRPSDGVEAMIAGMGARVIDCVERPTTAEELAEGVMRLATAFLCGGDVEGGIRALVRAAAPLTALRPAAPN